MTLLRDLRFAAKAAVGAAAMALAGCQSASLRSPPSLETPLPARFASASAGDAEPGSGVWWSGGVDPELTRLIEDSLSANQDLAEAAARVQASRAVLRETRAVGRPSLGLEGDLAANRQSTASFGTEGRSAEDQVSPSIGLAISWELDLFGRLARQVDSARAEAAATEAALSDLARIIAADVALAYLDLREAETRTDVAARNLGNQRRTLEITRILEENGKASGLDVARAEAQVASTQARLPRLRSQGVSARNRLTTLLGLEPGALDTRLSGSAGLPVMPGVVASGSPANLIRRRPDVRAAERSLAAASARIGVATADLYPSISLTGSAAQSSADLSGFNTGDAFGYSFGPSLRWNLFDRGAVYARIEQADANAAANLARFRQTVLVALEEVDSALSAFNEEAVRQEQLEAARDASDLAEELARARYEAGREPFLTVLDAERVSLGADDDLAVSAAERLRAQIRLYRALAGGWDQTTPTGPAIQEQTP